jgi:hypothetical protein
MARNHFRNKNYFHVRGGSLRFYLGFGGSHHVLIVFPTSSQLCSQCVSQVPNVFPSPPHRPPTFFLGIRIICMLGGEFDILFRFWWFTPCSHCVPNKFPTMLPMYSPSSQCVSSPPHGPPTILGIRIICMLGGVWDFIWVLVVPTMFSLCS